jgi:hypothetical protein
VTLGWLLFGIIMVVGQVMQIALGKECRPFWGTFCLQGAAAGAVATIFVGFNWGGWSLGSTADKMAKERSEAAVVAVLAPVCRAQPNAAAKIVATSKVDFYEDLRSKINTLELQRNQIARHCAKSLSTDG